MLYFQPLKVFSVLKILSCVPRLSMLVKVTTYDSFLLSSYDKEDIFNQSFSANIICCIKKMSVVIFTASGGNLNSNNFFCIPNLSLLVKFTTHDSCLYSSYDKEDTFNQSSSTNIIYCYQKKNPSSGGILSFKMNYLYL